jgi:hypothetical protein
MMIVIERTLAVTAAPAAVLDYLRDFANTQEWVVPAPRTSRTGDGPLVPGVTWRQSRRVLWFTTELTWTLIEVAPGRLLFHGRNEGATCADSVTVRPAGAGSEVTYRTDLELHGLAKLATPMLKAEFEKLATRCADGLGHALGRLTSSAWLPSAMPPPAPA